MTTLAEIKRLASELSNSAPRTQMEIVRLCKKLVLGIYDYLDLDELKDILEGLAQYDTRLEACETNKEDKLYMHKIAMQVQVHENVRGSLIFYVQTNSDTLFTLDTFKTYEGAKIAQPVFIGDSLQTLILNGRFAIIEDVTKLYVTLSCIDTNTNRLKNDEKQYDLSAITSFTDTII